MNTEKKKIIYSSLFPILFVSLMWIIKITETLLEINFVRLGNYPLKWEHIGGIITSPFIHGDFDHLMSNSLPFIILGSALFYFYRQHAFKIFIFLFIFSGLWVWLAARPSFHIGASGVVYALASFLIFSGFFHNNKQLTAIAFVVVFVYGSMVWGMFPGREGISWEGHLSGAITGFLAALLFSKKIADSQPVDSQTSQYTYDYDDFSISNKYYEYIEYHSKEKEEPEAENE